jgi:hypothetical protein
VDVLMRCVAPEFWHAQSVPRTRAKASNGQKAAAAAMSESAQLRVSGSSCQARAQY